MKISSFSASPARPTPTSASSKGFWEALLILAGCFMVVSPMQASLPTARQALSLLGDDTWARVLCIHNTSRHSQYPATVYAVVFEFNHLLWFYTDTNGTQSLTQYRGHLGRDKRMLAPLLRDIDPGFQTFSVVGIPDRGNVNTKPATLPNGCFIQSLYVLHELKKKNEPLLDAKLVTFYSKNSAGNTRYAGHTFLAYATPRGWYHADLQQSDRPSSLGRTCPNDPAEVAETAGYASARCIIVHGVSLPVMVNELCAPKIAGQTLPGQAVVVSDLFNSLFEIR